MYPSRDLRNASHRDYFGKVIEEGVFGEQASETNKGKGGRFVHVATTDGGGSSPEIIGVAVWKRDGGENPVIETHHSGVIDSSLSDDGVKGKVDQQGSLEGDKGEEVEKVEEEEGGNPAAGEFFSVIGAARPTDASWYLAFLGASPNSRGLGVGTSLLESGLSEIEKEGREGTTDQR